LILTAKDTKSAKSEKDKGGYKNNREGCEGCEEIHENKRLLFYDILNREALKLTVEDAEILISTAKIAKGCERSSVFLADFRVFSRLKSISRSFLIFFNE
jgi:hypothetical protein